MLFPQQELPIREGPQKPLLEGVLSQRPLGLVFDIDGTLSPIAPTPDQAQLYPGVASLLVQARDHAHVAIMTGRAIDNGAAMVDVEDLTYIGSHGLEWSDGLPSKNPVHIVPEALAYVKPGNILLDLAEQKLIKFPEIIVERKRIGGAIHYRLCPEPNQARQAIVALLEEPAHRMNMSLSEGKCVIEIKPSLRVNKGQALRQFVQRFKLHSVVFAGDDRTDLDAIMEIAQLRLNDIAAYSIAVQHVDSLHELLANADRAVKEVEGMFELLTDLVEALKKINLAR